MDSNNYSSTPSSGSTEWRSSTRSSTIQDSDTESILISYISPLTSPTSPTLRSPPSNVNYNYTAPTPNNNRPTSTSTTDSAELSIRLDLNPAVTISFVRGNRQFKLRFTSIDIYRNVAGELKSIGLNDYSKYQGSLSHQFPNSRQAIPHLERPAASEQAALRVSFLGTQTIQTAQTLFATEPTYTFEDEKDCIRFQEALLQQQVILVAGVAEVKSKGRGEECISQNLRVLRAPAGAFGMFYFANSQRKEKKRYVCIPLNAVDRIEPGKKGSKAISVRLRPNLELLAQLKTLQIKFLEESDYRTFYGILCQVVGLHAEG